MQVNYIVVRQRDDQPVEVVPFEDFDDAVRIFEDMRLNWTETYICRVIGGEGHALNNAVDLQTAHNSAITKCVLDNECEHNLNGKCYALPMCYINQRTSQ